MNRRPTAPPRAPVRPGRPGGPTTAAERLSPDRGPAPAPRVPRTVTTEPAAHEPVPAPAWVSGLLAGVQGALLSLLVLALPALAAYVATSADPTNADVPWPRAVGVGGALWLMGHGAPVVLDGVAVTLVPLGVTALALFACHASARRSGRPGRSAWLAGVGGHTAVVLVVLVVLVQAGTVELSPVTVLRVLAGTALVAGLGTAWGTVGLRGIRRGLEPGWRRVPPLVRAGATAGTLAVLLLVGLAALVVVGWVVSRRAPAGDVIAGLGLDTFGGALLAGAQLAFAPNLVLWVVGWLVGPGFSVGAETLYAPAEVVSGPLPALPMLAALPDTGSGGGLVTWAPVVVVLAGALAGWWLHVRVPVTRARQPFLLALVAGASAGVVAGALALLAGGGAGPGRLAVVGAPVLLVAGVVTLLVTAGALVVAVPAEARVRAAVRARLSRRPAPSSG